MIVSFTFLFGFVGILSFAILANCLQENSDRALNEYILHFEPVFFDQHLLSDQHRRSVRSTMDPYITLQFKAYNRVFRLRLKRDTGVFAEDTKFESSTSTVQYDKTRALVGFVEGPVSKALEVTTLEFCNGGDEKPPLGDNSSISSSPAKSNNTSVVVVPEPTAVVVERVYRDTSGVDDDQQRVPMYMVLSLVTGYICGGAVLFSLWEKWSFLDGAYFCFITLSTVGFGDLVPGSDIFDAQSGQAKLIICCLYLIMGLSIIAMSFNLVQEEVVIKCKNVARNLGLLKSDRDFDDDD